MPETGPYSLLILSFAIFSFVMLQLQRHPTSPPPLTLLKLGGGSALVMVSVAARLTVSQMLAILPPAEPDDLTMAVFDALLIFALPGATDDHGDPRGDLRSNSGSAPEVSQFGTHIADKGLVRLRKAIGTF